MTTQQQRLKNGVDTLEQVKEILGEKYSYALLKFYVDPECDLTDDQYNVLLKLGWAPDEDFYWRGE